MNGIISALNEYAPDILFLQETDADSARSKHTDEYAMIRGADPAADPLRLAGPDGEPETLPPHLPRAG
jgi:hypothetical protein